MIKAIITDVDGVIVGKKLGVNFPLPNEQVTKKLIELNQKGIPIILCTAKLGYAIYGIIKKAKLKNPHITDGGSVIIDLLKNKILKRHLIKKLLVDKIVEMSIKNDNYTEVYSGEEYYIDKSQVSEFTEKRISILQKDPYVEKSLPSTSKTFDVIKIITFIKDDSEKSKVEKIIKPFIKDISFFWTTHPAIYPVIGGVITAKGVSKKSAFLEVAEYLNVSPNETLGIGDLLSDWNFMEACGYVATIGDKNNELKKLAN